MVVPLWEIGRAEQLLSCKEMEIYPRENGTQLVLKNNMALFASFLPGRRSSRVDPMNVLRQK